MRKYIILMLLFLAKISYSQLKISDLTRFNIGKDSFNTRKEIQKSFSTKGILQKSETYSSVYNYIFKNSTFNYCDNASYDFLYVNDILCNLFINCDYVYNSKKIENDKFITSLETLVSGLKQKSNFSEFLHRDNERLDLKIVKEKIDSIDYYLGKDYNEDFNVIYSSENIFMIDNDEDQKFLSFTVLIYPIENKYIKTNSREMHLSIGLRLTSLKYQKHYKKYAVGTWENIKDETEVELTFENGVYKLPVTLNRVITLNFTLDLGASDVAISPDVFLVLYRTGTISDSDFIGTKTYKFADGSTAKSDVFFLKTLKIGDIELKNVQALISNNINAPLLLGQSALMNLPTYKIDNQNKKLILY